MQQCPTLINYPDWQFRNIFHILSALKNILNHLYESLRDLKMRNNFNLLFLVVAYSVPLNC